MRTWSETMSYWLLDYYALATVVLVVAVLVMGRLCQPVRRLSAGRSAFIGLAMLAVLAALPGWPRTHWRSRPGRTQTDRLEGHAGQIWHVAKSPDGQMGLTASQDRVILMWDLQTGKLIRRFRGHEGDVNNLAFSPDGKRFLSVSDDRTIRLWEVETGKELARWTGHDDKVGAVAISSNGKLVLTGADDSCICLWQIPE